jgi:DNA-binding XRE family transcriptional regulator
VSIRSLHKHACVLITFATVDISLEDNVWSPAMDDVPGLYTAVGRKIRSARDRSTPRLSQDNLAKRLGISRASIVNIEAGRQHAPLDLLWNIAQILELELTMLIPQRAELLAIDDVVELNDRMRKQIEVEASGSPTLKKSLTTIVGRLLTTIETDQPRKKP